jgi:hypothetical protein
MPKHRPVRISREQPGGINPGSYGRRAPGSQFLIARWTSQLGAAQAGAKEVLVKISGGGRDADGVQAHLEYIDRHGKLDLEDDQGERLQGKEAATKVVNDWAIDYGQVPGAPHSRTKGAKGRAPRQAFNIVLSMPAGTPPEKVLEAAKKFAREEFAHQHRYVMALHAEYKKGQPMHPHVHLVVKAEHEFSGRRLNPRKADLQCWRERFAEYMTELGVQATATRRHDRGLVKTNKRTPIHQATLREPRESHGASPDHSVQTLAGDSKFMRRKLEAVKREVRTDAIRHPAQYQSLLNVRAEVNERYREAITWLRAQGRAEEAKRFELMQRSLPPVATEQELLARRLAGQPHSGVRHEQPVIR